PPLSSIHDDDRAVDLRCRPGSDHRPDHVLRRLRRLLDDVGRPLVPKAAMSTTGLPYRGKSGQWAFIGHRITGFLVFVFLLLHVVDVSLVQDRHLYNEVHAVYGNVVLRVFEVSLLFALVFHALNGLRIIHFTLTHILHDVVTTNYGFVAHRWHNLGWRIFDWSLLALALAHGLNGLRLIVDDYVRTPGKRAATKATLYTLTGVLFAYGTM